MVVRVLRGHLGQPLFKQLNVELVAQDHVQMVFKDLQGESYQSEMRGKRKKYITVTESYLVNGNIIEAIIM